MCEPWDPEAWSGDDYFVLRVISWRGRAQANARAPKAQKIDACGAKKGRCGPADAPQKIDACGATKGECR